MGKTNFDIVEANSFIGPDGPITGEGGSVTIPNPLEVDIVGNVTGNLTGKIVGTAIDMDDATATESTEEVDPEEFAAVVALVNACKAKINSIIVVEDED